MLNFTPVITEDGTFSLYNNQVNDIYHSKIGAYTEALHKFVIPSEILEFVKSNNSVKILDICYGLGYNSKVATNEIMKINPNCKISITAIEMDLQIVFLSALTSFTGMNDLIKKSYFDLISSHNKFEEFIVGISSDVNFASLINSCEYFKEYKSSSGYNLNEVLHNIYYRTLSSRNKTIEELNYNNDLLNVGIYIGDARDIVLSLDDQYDYIFHDPFTSYKLPTLWSAEMFKELHRLLNCNGNLTTYSSSATVRAGMVEAGFSIGQTDAIGRRAYGTIAYKQKSLIKCGINSYDLGLLETNAGIPYYDPDLSFSSEEIFKFRENIQSKSGRMSTSKYLKKPR